MMTLLYGCATPHKQPIDSISAKASPDKLWEQHLALVSALTDWEAKGKIAVSKSNEGESASFVWNQNEDAFHMRLFGPFGSGSMELLGDKSQVILHQGKKVASAPTAEQLLFQEIRWHVPISGLKYWARGIPVPNVPIQSMVLDEDGNLSQLTQQGWNITYSKYDIFDQFPLPGRLHLISHDLEVKLVIRNWQRK